MDFIEHKIFWFTVNGFFHRFDSKSWPSKLTSTGKMSFDLDPKVISTWFVPFVNTWSSFVERNPNVVISGLYVTDGGISYGSPTDMEISYLLMGYSGLPLLLQHFRSVFTRLMSKIMGIGKQKPTDLNVWVPLGS